MRQLVFSYEGYKITNIGDYIQSLAALQYSNTPNNIFYWNRDELNAYDGTNAYAIMNGWFTHKPYNWPPSEKITPLFVATHFNSSAYNVLLSDESIKYLKSYEPIGCRDINTVRKLREHGIDAYFSSCLTTTLGMTYKSDSAESRNGIYIVDPVHYIPEMNGRFRKYMFLTKYIRYKKGVDSYIKSLLTNNSYKHLWSKDKLNIMSQATRSYILLSEILGKELLAKAVVITQSHDEDDMPTRQVRYDRAKELIKMYSHAELVITSRIHCALPCLGLETPVIFLQNMDDSVESTCRFEGLIDLMNVIKFKKDKIVQSFTSLPIKIDGISNKPDYRQYADALIKKCKSFVEKFGG